MGNYITWLADAARATEYPVIETAGWWTRGHGPLNSLEGVVGHHTGTPAKVLGDFPTLNVVRDGRSDLAGPLCNLGIGRSGTIYVIAAGTAWHAGASAHAGFTSLNDKFLAIEAESDGSGNWTAAQLECYPRLVGELLKRMGRLTTRYVSHRTCALPRGRKTDPTGITDEWMRDRADKWRNRGFPIQAPLGSDVLKYGSSGDAVRHLQEILNRRYPSYSHLPVTGFYGEMTKGVVEEFQRRWNVSPTNVPKLAIDGMCGPATKRAIGW